MGTPLDYRVPGNEQVGELGDSSWPTPQIPSQIHPLTLASQATSGQCQEVLPTYSLNLPDPLHFFARPPIPSLGSEERPRSSPDYGKGLPTLGLRSQGASSPGPGRGRDLLLPLPVGGGGAEYWASVPVLGPHPGASRPWPRPLFSAGTGRVAGFQLHVPSWAGCQGAGAGPGAGPAGKTVQLGKSGGSGDGTGGRDCGPWAKEGQGRDPLGGHTCPGI